MEKPAKEREPGKRFHGKHGVEAKISARWAIRNDHTCRKFSGLE